MWFGRLVASPCNLSDVRMIQLKLRPWHGLTIDTPLLSTGGKGLVGLRRLMAWPCQPSDLCAECMNHAVRVASLTWANNRCSIAFHGRRPCEFRRLMAWPCCLSNLCSKCMSGTTIALPMTYTNNYPICYQDIHDKAGLAKVSPCSNATIRRGTTCQMGWPIHTVV